MKSKFGVSSPEKLVDLCAKRGYCARVLGLDHCIRLGDSCRGSVSGFQIGFSNQRGHARAADWVVEGVLEDIRHRKMLSPLAMLDLVDMRCAF